MRTRMLILVSLALSAALPLPAQGSGGRPLPAEMVRLPAGSYRPLYARPGGEPVPVAAFALDRRLVSRGDFLAFVRANPRWQKGRVPRVFAEARYLASWPSALDAGEGGEARRPVTEVSWFAAKAYCEWRGKRLPTADEWEYAAAADEARRDAARDPAFIARLLVMYTTRGRERGTVGSGFRNAYGVGDLHALAWEWVLDFNNVLVSTDSRGSGGRDHQLWCAAAALGATDPGNYPAFLRHAFRAGLTGQSAAPNLGFRCAQSL